MIAVSRKTITRLGLIVIAAAPIAADADVGRLFFTPSERAAFEGARQAGERDPVPELIEPEPEELIELIDLTPDEPKPTITVDGYVRRSNGGATLWLNGENSYDGDLSASGVDPGSARLRGGRISVTPVDAKVPIRLRPGQSYDPNSAQTTDVYETGAWPDEFR